MYICHVNGANELRQFVIKEALSRATSCYAISNTISSKHKKAEYIARSHELKTFAEFMTEITIFDSAIPSPGEIEMNSWTKTLQTT